MGYSPQTLRRLGLLIKTLVVVVTLILIDQEFKTVLNLTWVNGSVFANVALVFAFWTTLLAPGFYLIALWWLGAFFGRQRTPEEFSQAIVQSLRETGQCLLIGAPCALLVEPAAMTFLTAEGGNFPLSEMVEDLTIGLIGLALYVLAAAGQRVHDELTQIV